MGINSTEVSYGFGQFGSAITDSTSATLYPPRGLRIVAITALADTTFDASAGLVGELNKIIQVIYLYLIILQQKALVVMLMEKLQMQIHIMPTVVMLLVL